MSETRLEQRFDELREEGYIYEVDENGQGMSYGEFSAINDDLQMTLEEGYADLTFPDTVDYLKSELNSGDDVFLFVNVSKYEEFLDNLETIEVDGTDYYRLYKTPDNVPETLMEKYNDYVEDTQWAIDSLESENERC